jgi:hypothetical protein
MGSAGKRVCAPKLCLLKKLCHRTKQSMRSFVGFEQELLVHEGFAVIE